MAKSASFFMSRINKAGILDHNKILDALRQSISVESRGVAWTVIDVLEGHVTHDKKKYKYLSGKLVKYDPDALVEVVDEETRKTRLQHEPNMQRAASLFVYFPDETVFGHRKIWNQISERDFRVQIAELIVNFHGKFFVECELQPITDLSRFLSKLARIDEVSELKAQVFPSNPLFSPYWRKLNDYLKERRLRRMAIKESAKPGVALQTSAPEIVRRIETAAVGAKSDSTPIGDAAILMATDGYGHAEVTGRSGSTVVVVKTSESSVHLKLEADVSSQELAKAVINDVLARNKGRRLTHK